MSISKFTLTTSLVTFALSAVSAQAQVRDAAAEFTANTPPADWSYMQRTGTGCISPGSTLPAGYNPAAGLVGYVAGPIPLVAKNTNSSQSGFSSMKVDAGKLWLHPGTHGECAVVRFKAPSAGTYTVAVTMKAADFASPNDVRAYVFGSGAPGAAVGSAEVLNAAGVFGATKSFSRTVSVQGANRFIDVALDDGGNPDPQGSFRFDSTQMDIVIERQGRPNGNGEAEQGNGIPVLNCSQSPNNPVSINLSSGQPGWTLKLPNGSASTIAPTPSMVPSPWTAVPGAQWVGPQGAPTTPGLFVYETKVRVLKCPNGQPAKITASFRADNIGTLTLLDPTGSPVTSMAQAGTANYGFLQASLSPSNGPGVHSWSAPINGIYTIRMTVQNSGGPTGMATNVVLTR